MSESAPPNIPAPALAEVLDVGARAWSRLRSGQSLDRALEAALAGVEIAASGSRARLAGAARDLVSAAVRRAATLEFVLAELVHRPPDPPVQDLLSVALAQLLARSYADFTLVDQAVRAARSQPSTAAASGFVNAILREFLRRREALEEQAARVPARRFNVPDWWYHRVLAEYGARAPGILAAQLEEPPMVLRVNARRATVDAVRGELTAAGIENVPAGRWGIRLQRAVPVERVPGFAQGRVSVQDAGAQLAAPWIEAASGMRVLDACAAPGGKTAHLLEISDCQVDAVEKDPLRALRIDENLRRLGLAGARVHVADVLEPRQYWDGAAYDRILLDAPCTASGVVRRHPDVVLLRREADVAKLATQQGKMLRSLWPLLAPAGRLLYVVCSVFAEEGRRQVSAFLRHQPGARPIALAHGDAGGLQLLPSPATAESEGSDPALPVLHDGFFYALLEKN